MDKNYLSRLKTNRKEKEMPGCKYVPQPPRVRSEDSILVYVSINFKPRMKFEAKSTETMAEFLAGLAIPAECTQFSHYRESPDGYGQPPEIDLTPRYPDYTASLLKDGDSISCIPVFPKAGLRAGVMFGG